VAVTSLTGTVTSPNVIVPLQIGLGTRPTSSFTRSLAALAR